MSLLGLNLRCTGCKCEKMDGEVRILPVKDSDKIHTVCQSCFDYVMGWRMEANTERGDQFFSIYDWQELETYQR